MKKTTHKPKLGWQPDVPDQRDWMYTAQLKTMQSLPTKVDLRSKCPTVLNQGNLGSCTANALASAFQFGQKKQGIPTFAPSRLFIYYNERKLENSIPYDNGAQIRDGIKSLNADGVCAETNWTYDDNSHTGAKFTQTPPAICYTKALTNQIVNYARLNNSSLMQLKSCLADGNAFVFGFTVYTSFFSIKANGMMPMRQPTDAREGGHAVMAVGYDDAKQVFIVRNSWGTTWGDKGYFYMPYAYITDTNLADDFWTIQLVEAGLKTKKKSTK